MKVRCIYAGWSDRLLCEGRSNADELGVVGVAGVLFSPHRFEPVAAEVASAHPGWEPDKDLLNLAFPCPKADPYAEHRLRECSAVAMELHDRASGATARLHAGLESEKVRERVKPFPKQGRNFALKGGGDE